MTPDDSGRDLEARIESGIEVDMQGQDLAAADLRRLVLACNGNSAVRIRRARIRGVVDLRECGSPARPLPSISLVDCVFEEAPEGPPGLDISDAYLGALTLSHSRFTLLNAAAARITGSVDLSGVRPAGDAPDDCCRCHLARAVIDGHVFVNSTRLRSPHPRERRYAEAALNLFFAQVRGSVVIGVDEQVRRKRGYEESISSIDGAVLLDAAQVDGDVRIESARLLPYDWFALGLERARIGGSVMLGQASPPSGEPVCEARIWMWGATISGSLDIMTRRLRDPRRLLLYARKASVGGDVTLYNSDTAVDGADAPRGWAGGLPTGMNLTQLHCGGSIRIQGSVLDDIELTDARCTTLDVDLPADRGSSWVKNDGFRFERIGSENHWVGDLARYDCWLPSGDAYRPQPYVQLARVLIDRGEERLARDVLERKAWRDADRTWRRPPGGSAKAGRSVRWVIRRGWSLLAYRLVSFYGHLFRFGLSPLRAVLTILLFLGFGFLLFWLIDVRHALVVSHTPVAGYDIDAHTFTPSVGGTSGLRNVACGDAVSIPVYAADVFIPLIDFREEGKCEIDADDPDPGDAWREPGWWEVRTYRLLNAAYALAGWVVTTLALLTFSGVTRHRLLGE